jgi:hypothetical protein
MIISLFPTPGNADTKNKARKAVLASPSDQSTRMLDNVDTYAFGDRTRLKELRVAHRDLDVAITELSTIPHVDQLRIRRLKKQKLRLKDMINKLESELIPDLNA